MIMNCIRLVTFYILINGEPQGFISPSRGLHQGNPLSPYLFLFYTKGLIALLQDAEQKRLTRGLKISKGTPSINHLLFADDSLVFCKDDVVESKNLKDLLASYKMASG